MKYTNIMQLMQLTYDKENRLKIRRIYDAIPSTLKNKKKRIVIQNIENKKGKRFSDYQDEFDYLIHAGITLEVKAIATPVVKGARLCLTRYRKQKQRDTALIEDTVFGEFWAIKMDNTVHKLG